MRRLTIASATLVLSLFSLGRCLAESPAVTTPQPIVVQSGPAAPVGEIFSPWNSPIVDGSLTSEPERRPFESDRAFDNFIGPISNPIFTKDPRALTEARLLFIQNHIPSGHPLGGGDFQVYALQVRVALTDRLSFIADKDGHAVIKTPAGGKKTGWLNLAAGLKYSFIRDEERQLLVTSGFMFEPQTGEADVFQSNGRGLFTVFGTLGKEFGCKNHLLLNGGYHFPVDSNANSSLFYAQVHLDRQMFGWMYPLVELNWFHWTQGGNRGLPPALGEGDGLLNLGTTGVAGNDLVTVAAGLKAKLSRNLDAGFAYEVPISNRKDLLSNRVIAELILRY